MLDEAKMRRLAMIQYMYTMAVDHVNKPEPLNMIAILNFHDAVELFLAFAAEHLNVGKEDQKFVTYWDVINPALPNKDFGQRASMTRLNKARVGWKHYGILGRTPLIGEEEGGLKKQRFIGMLYT